MKKYQKTSYRHDNKFVLIFNFFNYNIEMNETRLLDLPPEIVLIIIENLPDKDIFRLGLSCKLLNEITSSYVELGNL